MNFRLVALVTGMSASFASIVISLTLLFVAHSDGGYVRNAVYTAEIAKATAAMQKGVAAVWSSDDGAYASALAKHEESKLPSVQLLEHIPAALGLGILFAIIGTLFFFRQPSKFRFHDHKEEPFRFAAEFHESLR